MTRLDDERGHLVDRATQEWVRVTGRRVDLDACPWLSGPIGRTSGIGPEYFSELAGAEGLCERREPGLGLVRDLGVLAGPECDPAAVDRSVAHFYERTAEYSLDAWGEWRGAFRPFGWLVARLFSRRLQQLNVPLSALDTSRGIRSEVIQLVDPESGEVRHTAWLRELVGSGDVLYAGTYATTSVPGYGGPCVKVVFPLPNGNAMVIMRPSSSDDGSLTLTSSGRRFGDPGFYFTVHDGSGVRARYLRTFRESIRVHAAEGVVRADHHLTLWGMRFLRLHYRCTAGAGGSTAETSREGGEGA